MSGLLYLLPGDLPDPGIELASLMPPALAGGFFTTSAMEPQDQPLLNSHPGFPSAFFLTSNSVDEFCLFSYFMLVKSYRVSVLLILTSFIQLCVYRIHPICGVLHPICRWLSFIAVWFSIYVIISQLVYSFC